ncbi:DUF5677 domain-containing protein [Amycolatopsis sp. NPDC051061]|uniref:DUF5677 domain-containing protein n=1 Tax=Amycolatopsis sp. NPDC051061 TaxID=3155042 RepID=UPI0034420E62
MQNKRSLEEIIESLYALHESIPKIQVDESTRRTAIMAHGWYMSLIRTSKAVLALDKLGFGHEAAPMRRSMLEHALGIVWLSVAGEDAVNSIIKAYQDVTFKKIKESIQGTSETELLQLVREYVPFDVAPSSEGSYLHFKHLCERFGVHRLYIAWLRNTSLSHASFSSAVAYVDSVDGSLILLREPNLSEPPDSLSSSNEIAALLLLATNAFSDLLVNKPWKSQITQIEQELSNIVGFKLDTHDTTQSDDRKK